MTKALDYRVLESSRQEKSPVGNVLWDLADIAFNYNGPSHRTYSISLTGARLPMRRLRRASEGPARAASARSRVSPSPGKQQSSPPPGVPFAQRPLQCSLIYRGHSKSPGGRSQWSPDGKWLATTDFQTIQVWEAATGHCCLTYSVLDTEPRPSVYWLSDGKHLIVTYFYSRSGSRDGSPHPGRIDILEAATGICRFRYPIADSDSTKDEKQIAWSPDGTLMAAICGDTVQVWTTVLSGGASNQQQWTLPGQNLKEIVWSPTGKLLVGLQENSLLFWNIATKTYWWSPTLPSDRTHLDHHWSPNGGIFRICLL